MGHGIKKSTLNKIWKQKRFCMRQRLRESKIENLLKKIFPEKEDTNLDLSKENENYELEESNLTSQEEAWIHRYKRKLKEYNNYTNYNYIRSNPSSPSVFSFHSTPSISQAVFQFSLQKNHAL